MEPCLQDRLQDRRVVASISGGKDSAAMSLWLTEQGIDHDRVHLLTGWDSDVTMEYIRCPLTATLGPIAEIRGPMLMEELVRHKGLFPSRARRYCTEELKLRPLQRYLAALMDGGVEVISAVGIRAAESAARAHMTEWEWSPQLDCEVWRPLIGWTEQEVIDTHKRHGLAPNPLYLMGAHRVGCWPCVMARKSEIRLVADTDPGRLDKIRELERDLTEGLRERCAATGEAQRWPELTFFQGVNSAARKDGQTWPIDKTVAWSRTARGGKAEDQQELFGGMSDGCMRWGMCGA